MTYKISVIIAVLLIMTSCQNRLKEATQNQSLYTSSIGVQAYSFRNYFPKDAIGTLDKIQAMGITSIEGDGGKIPPEEYKKLCHARGINIPSTSCTFDQLEKEPMAVVKKAKALGADYVMVAWIPHKESGSFSLEEAQYAIEVFNKSGKILADQGITFCYHFHGYEFQPHEDGTLLDYIVNQTDPRYVSFEMDIFWIHFGGGDPVKLLKKYPNRWKLIHLKDMKKGTTKDLTGQTDVENSVPLGTGEIDIKEILITGKEIGIAHYFIEDESSVVMNQVPESIRFLQSLKL